MRLFLLLMITTLAITACSKKSKEEKLCGSAYGETPRIAYPAYMNPQWDPTGNLIVFNHAPVSGLVTNTCGLPYFKVKPDSAGLYMIKKDGTGFKRITDRGVENPQWSPDGKWLAYSYMGNIMMIPFNGTAFDTAARVKLTTNGQNSYFTWSPNSDSVFYLNTSTASVSSLGKIFRIATDGTGITQVAEGANQFFVTNDRIYFNQVRDIFSIKKDGSDKQQLTSGNDYKYFMSVYNNTVFYETNMMGFWSLAPGGSPTLLEEGLRTYDISATGEIVYSKYKVNTDVENSQNGTLWLMNADGSNKRQLTYNHHK